MRLLIAEDQRDLTEALTFLFEKNQFTVDAVYDGRSAYDYAVAGSYDAIILDVMMPGLTGIEVLRRLREENISTPVMMLTAKAQKDDRITGFNAGADDYLPKPFEIVELLARVESVLRRAGKGKTVLTQGDVTINLESMQVTRAGKPVLLTRKEFDLLVLFMQNPNVALFRETIYERVWETEELGDSRTVDLHVQRLRKKLGWQQRLAAVYKVGYRLEGDG